MLKVANVIMEGRFGGPQARIAAVAEKMKSYGIKTIVVFPNKNSNIFYNKLKDKGIKTKRLELHRITKDKTHLVKFVIFFIPELLSLYLLFKKEHVDIVHCNGSWQLKGFIAGKLAGAKVVWHLNDTYMPPIIYAVFKWLAFYFCDSFITAGEKVRNYYLADGRFKKKQIIEIQAPVDTSVFDPNKVKEDHIISKYKGLKIVTVGNLNPLKGIEYFVEMASVLNKQYNNLVFFVVGSLLTNQKEYSKKVFELVKKFRLKNFHFYGPSDRIPSILKATDIYVCSSIAEASPISVWEAIAMAKPIVTTDVGDVSRFIKNEESGFVVPTKNLGALTEKTSLLIKNENIRNVFGQKVRKIALQYLDIDICAKKHKQFYKEVLNKL